MSLDLLCIASGSHFIKINPAWQSVLGYSEEDLLGKPFLSFIHPDDVESTLQEVDRLNRGEKTINFENRYRCKDGSYKWLSWYTSPDPNSGLLYAVAHDISPQKELNELLLKKTEQLERSNREMEQFAYVASHDLQEPLRTISNYVGLFQKRYQDKLDQDSAAYLGFISSSTSRMQALIKGLLEYSRIGRNQQKENIPTAKIIDEVLQDLHLLIQESHAQIEVGTLPVIRGYSDIKNVFQNLLSNAIKFRRADQHPHIRIDAKLNRDHWVFSFSDNGVGIHSDYHDRIFIIFQTLHQGEHVRGTGIGLAHCKKIIELHGGKIWLQSEPDHGSTFYFSIPL